MNKYACRQSQVWWVRKRVSLVSHVGTYRHTGMRVSVRGQLIGNQLRELANNYNFKETKKELGTYFKAVVTTAKL